MSAAFFSFSNPPLEILHTPVSFCVCSVTLRAAVAAAAAVRLQLWCPSVRVIGGAVVAGVDGL